MLAVIFEVIPREGYMQQYLEIAQELKPLLATIDGFISLERFQSMSQPGKYLSLSYWRDEEAIQQWRNTEQHRQAQQTGRAVIFDHYTLHIVTVVRAYDGTSREQAPADSEAYHQRRDSHQ